MPPARADPVPGNDAAVAEVVIDRVALEVPTLGAAGLVLLALACAAAALGVFGRRK